MSLVPTAIELLNAANAEISRLQAENEALRAEFNDLQRYSANSTLEIGRLREALILCNQAGPGNYTDDLGWKLVYCVSSKALNSPEGEAEG